MKIDIITDNSGKKREIYADVKVGDKFISHGKISKMWEMDFIEFIKDKEYFVKSITMWGFVKIGYIVDEFGTSHFVETKYFTNKAFWRDKQIDSILE